MTLSDGRLPAILKALAHTTCQETTGMIGDRYLRCGAPGTVLVQHNGRSEGPYVMCGPCADHNVHNRDATVVAYKQEFTIVCIGVGSGSGYRIDDRYMPEVYVLLSKLERKSR